MDIEIVYQARLIKSVELETLFMEVATLLRIVMTSISILTTLISIIIEYELMIFIHEQR